MLIVRLKKILAKYSAMSIQMKASLWFLLSATFQRGFSVITAPIFTRLLSTTEYGEFNVFNSWYSIVSIIITFNLFYGVYMQGLIKFEDDKKVFISSLQGLELLLIVIWSSVYFVFRDFWNDLLSISTIQMVLLLLLVWITAIYNFWAGEQRAEFKYKKLVCLTIVATILKPLVSILLILNVEDKVTARIAGGVIVDYVLYFSFFFKHMFNGKKLYSKKYWVHALRFNIPLVPHYLSQIVLSSSDRIMISNMVGTSEAGIYSLAYSVSTLMSLFNTALMQTLEPWLYKKIRDNKVEDIKKVMYPSLIGVAVLNLLLIAFAPEIVNIFAPADYFNAAELIPPIAMSVYFVYLYSFFAIFEFYFEKTKLITTATLIGAVFNILSNYIFIGIFGYQAASYTTLLCYVLFAVLHSFFTKQVLRRSAFRGRQIYDVRVVVGITFAFLLMGFAFLFIYNYVFIRASVVCIIIAVCILERNKFISVVKLIK